MSSSGDWIDEADGETPSSAMMRGFAAAILAIWGGFIMLAESAFQGVADLFDVFGAAREFFVVLLTSPTSLLSGSYGYALQSLTTGDWAFFGPFTPLVAVAVIAAAWRLWAAIDPEIPLVDDIVPWR